MFDLLARLAVQHRWRVIAAAAILAALAAAVGAPVVGLLRAGGFDDPAAASIQADRRFEQATGIRADGGLLVLVRVGDLSAPAARSEVERVAATVAGDPAVDRTLTYYQTQSPALISRDGRSTLVVGQLKKNAADSAALRIRDALRSDPKATVGGSALALTEVSTQVSEDLAKAELLAFPILFVLSLWVFRSPVASLLPLAVGGLTIVGAFLGLRLVDSLTPLSIFALNLCTGLGLGLAIDYSLFIVSSYREERAASLAPGDAISRTLRTAGRTILFSSLTVAAAMASLLVFPQEFLYSMGIGGILVALLACAVALVVLPAVLLVLGDRINWLAPHRWQRPLSASSGFWYRLSLLVIRRPLPIALLGAAILLGLGLPATGIKFTSIDASVLPPSAGARQVSDALRADFTVGASPAIFVIAGGAQSSPEVKGLADRIGQIDGVAGVQVQAAGSNSARIDVSSRAGDLTPETQGLVRSIRQIDSSGRMLVGGPTAKFVDLQASLAAHLPAAIAIVAVATVLLLFLMTGSIVLPIKAVAMNLLTLSAAYGVLVLIFQQGRLTQLLDFTSQGALEATQPVLIFALVFGLSTDYGVFLLGRIKEGHDRGLANSEAVAQGLARTGRIVTAAAVLFCVAIGAFATSQIVFIKELGVGTAAGVLIDATIVRALLVPALMGLLGRWNWWAPAFLTRLHSRIGLSEQRSPARTETPETQALGLARSAPR